MCSLFSRKVSVRPSVSPKTSKSSDNHCRPGLWAGNVVGAFEANSFILKSSFWHICINSLGAGLDQIAKFVLIEFKNEFRHLFVLKVFGLGQACR